MELLAHCSAVCSHKSDSRCRKQARNYDSAHWQQVTRIRKSSVHSIPQIALASPVFAKSAVSGSERHFTAACYNELLGDTQLAVAALESQIVTSSLIEAGQSGHLSSGSEVSARDVDFHDRKDTALLGWHSLPQGPISNTSNEQNLPHSASCTTAPVAVSNEVSHPARHTSSHSTAWSENQVQAELPSTYEISDESSANPTRSNDALIPLASASGVQHDERAMHLKVVFKAADPADFDGQLPFDADRSGITASGDKVPARECLPMEPVSSGEVHEIARDGPNTTTRGVAPARQPAASQQCHVLTHANASNQVFSDSDWNDLPLEINAPAPITGLLEKPRSLVTPSLLDLINNPQLIDRFRPKSTSRSIIPTERGYWSFVADEDNWSAETARDMWDFLRRLIENGHAGWGVWCVRIPSTDKLVTGHASLGQVRVFCWGEIVQHVYLLLYVASKSKIKRARPVWYDANGEAVIKT
ncbi:hypothetical protein ANO11243_085320 [Dothideomycetidae sp. 11243]|nr:hypothetical protein ANO11243_085320 [fungal sp. No.11243]